MSRILVVDDEPSIRITIQAFLQRAGYQVDNAPDSMTAYGLLMANEYDVILTDIVMPQMTGLELLSLVRQHSRDVQVIVMTGEPTVDSAILSVKNGANDYLTKPIDKETLLKTIRQAVRIKQLSDEKTSLEMERARYLIDLEKIVDDRTQDLQKALQNIVMLLSSVVEIRDPYTAGHQRRVGNLAAAIAERMGLGQQIANIVRITGYLHDIGKMAVPAEILTRPGRLNQYEMGLIRTHSQQGYEMLKQIDLPGHIAEIAWQHHERLDGSGYPQGLTQDGLLMEANILAVADVVEAMMSHRPYRPALGLTVALDEIRSKRNIQYCAQCVDACVQLFENDNYTLDDSAHAFVIPISSNGVELQS